MVHLVELPAGEESAGGVGGGGVIGGPGAGAWPANEPHTSTDTSTGSGESRLACKQGAASRQVGDGNGPPALASLIRWLLVSVLIGILSSLRTFLQPSKPTTTGAREREPKTASNCKHQNGWPPPPASPEPAEADPPAIMSDNHDAQIIADQSTPVSTATDDVDSSQQVEAAELDSCPSIARPMMAARELIRDDDDHHHHQGVPTIEESHEEMDPTRETDLASELSAVGPSLEQLVSALERDYSELDQRLENEEQSIRETFSVEGDEDRHQQEQVSLPQTEPQRRSVNTAEDQIESPPRPRDEDVHEDVDEDVHEDEWCKNFDDYQDDCCGPQASCANLQRLRAEAQQDLSVCEANRAAVAAARRLFDGLSMRRDGGGARSTFAPDHLHHRYDDDHDGGELAPHVRERYEQRADLDDGIASYGRRPSDDDEDLYDCIKIVRRSGSSASSCGRAAHRQTLVCSLSPTSQLSCSDLGAGSRASPAPSYPLEEDELAQCQAAFRENRRLIADQQVERQSVAGPPQQVSPSSRPESKWRWTPPSQLERPASCTCCSERLYPVDKLELDFIRKRLNMHRHCFRCHTCSSLLRLETYAALEGRLYCPAHARQASPLLGQVAPSLASGRAAT